MAAKTRQFREIVTRLAGLILPSTARLVDTPPPAAPPRVIVGGAAAPELCMIPSERRVMVCGKSMPDFTGFGSGRRVAQLKADGINAMYLDGRVIGGREGGPLDCALQCQPGLQRLEEAFGHPMVFFGEYVANDGFNATLAEHKAGRGEGAFWLYDAVPHGAWVTGHDYEVPIERRLTDLRDRFHGADAGLFVGMLDWWLLDAQETAAKARELWAAGFEGLVSKEAGSGYSRRRDPCWWKVKERFEAPCAVVDTIHKGGKLHTVIVRGPEPSNSKPLRLAGGWSEREAETIDIGMADGSQGRIVAVEFELTTGATRSIRGARFAGLVA
jgi:hypothetical protein